MLRAAPCPGHPGTPRCSEPDPVAEQGAGNSGRGGAVGSTGPDPSGPWLPSVRRPNSPGVPTRTKHSPGATSGELTAPPTNTEAASTADPGSPHGAIAASLCPPRPGRRVPDPGERCSSRAAGWIECRSSAPASPYPLGLDPPRPRPQHGSPAPARRARVP